MLQNLSSAAVLIGALKVHVPVNKFSVVSWRLPVFLGWTNPQQRIKCLAQVTLPVVSLELATLGSLVFSNWATVPRIIYW